MLKYGVQWLIVCLVSVFLTGCSYEKEVETLTESSSLSSEPVTKLSWKVVDYGGQPYFHLYVTLNNEEYYAGYFFGENFETGEWADTPDNALTAFGAIWTGAGNIFYIYQKNETELALMNRYSPYGEEAWEVEAYKEIMTIPIPKESRIIIGDVIDEQERYGWSQDYAFILYDSFVLGGLDVNDRLVSIFEADLSTYWNISGNWGFRLFRDGKYLDTVSYQGFEDQWLEDIISESNNPEKLDSLLVKLDYQGEAFDGLAINDGEPLSFGAKASLNPSADVYTAYIAEILADGGLEGEPVHIREVVKTDLEGDGIDEVLVIASNVDAPDQTKGQYSIVVLRKLIDGQVRSIFLTKQIEPTLPDGLENRLLYDYELREIVDLDHDGICELLLARTYYEGQFYQVYKLIDGNLQLVMENGFGV